MQISSLRRLDAFKQLFPLKALNPGCDKIISLYFKSITMKAKERPPLPTYKLSSDKEPFQTV